MKIKCFVRPLLACLLAAGMLMSFTACGNAGTGEALAAAQAELAALTEANADQAKRIESLEDTRDRLNDRVESLKTELNGVKTENGQLKLEISSAELGFDPMQSSGNVLAPEHRLWLTANEDGETLGRYHHFSGVAPYAHLTGSGVLIEAYAAVEVMDLDSSTSEIWLLCHKAPGDSGEHVVFWTRQADLVPYTSANMDDLIFPVTIRPGAMVEVVENLKTEVRPASDRETQSHGSIGSIEDGVATVRLPGGRSAKVAAADLIYPDPETFTFQLKH